MSDHEQSTPEGKRRRAVKSTPMDHTYHDYANEPIHAAGEGGREESRTLNFPAKLHLILSTLEFEHIICWMPHGRSWMVKDKDLLISVVLKEHFSHSNFDTFNRQVNHWGFKRLHRVGMDYKTYYHEAFLRGRPDLTYLVKRLKKAGKRVPNIDAEPNFYQMTFLPETNRQSQPQSQPQIQNIAPFAMQSLPSAVGAQSIASGLSASPGNGSIATLLQNYQAAVLNFNLPQVHPHSLQGMIYPSQYAISPYVQHNQSSSANPYSPFIHNFQGATAYTIDNEIAQRILQNAALQAPSFAAASYPNVLSNLTMAGFQGVNNTQTQPLNNSGLTQLSGVNPSYLNQRLPAQLPQEFLMPSASLGFARDATNIVAGNIPTARQGQVTSAQRNNQIATASAIGNTPNARQFQLTSALRSNPLPTSAALNDPMMEEFADRYNLHYSTGNGRNGGNSGGTGDNNSGT